MSSRGFPLYLLAIALLLVGLSVLLSVGVFAVEPPVDGGGVTAPESDSGQPNVVAPGDLVRVSITTRDRGRLLTPSAPSLRCELRLGRTSVAADATLVAGPGAALRSDAAGRHLVRYAIDGGADLFRVVHLGSVADVAVVALGPEAELRGVVTGPDGEPVADAEVWTGTAIDGEPQFEFTDAAGRFAALARYGGEGIPIVVRRRGFASRFRVVDVLDGGDDIAIRLEPATALEVRFAAVLDDPETARVAIVPASPGVALRHYPFFMGIFDGPLRLDADASCVVRDLPRAGQVQVAIAHPDTIAATPVRADLARADRQAVVVSQRALDAFYTARVVGVDGEPVADARVELRREGRAVWTRAHGWMLPPGAHRVDGRVAVTDADGRFRIGRPRGAATLQVRAATHCGVEIALASGRRGPAEIELPALVADAGDGPALLFDFNRDGRRCLVRTNGGEWREWPAEERIELGFDSPALLDVEVRVDSGAGSGAVRRTFPRQAVVGSVVIDLQTN